MYLCKKKNYFIFVVLFFMLLTVIFSPVQAMAASSDNGFFRSYMPPPTGNVEWYFDRPEGLAADMFGNIYVADTYNSRVQKFNSNGELITKWGSVGDKDGQFGNLEGIAVDHDGYVYVIDTVYGFMVDADTGDSVDCRVQKFDSNGRFIKKWGTKGTAEGQFQRPEGIAVGPDGYIYVTDYYNSNIQKFNSNGEFIKEWGSFGSGNGKFCGPQGIAIDRSGNMYVVDSENNRTQKFDKNGNFIKKWGSNGSLKGKLDMPFGITLDDSGFVYVSDTENNRIQKFDTNGKVIASWERTDSNKICEPRGIVYDGFGNVYFAEANRIFKYDQKGKMLNLWSSVGGDNGSFYYVPDIAFDSEDNLYALDNGNYCIRVYNKAGNFLKKWNTYEGSVKSYADPVCMAMDHQGRIYVADELKTEIKVFDKNGRFIEKWGKTGEEPGQFSERIQGMAFDKEDNLFIADKYNSRIQVFSKDGEFIRTWGFYNGDTHLEAGELCAPSDLAIGKDGLVYVVNSGFNGISVFDKTGNFIKFWGSKGKGNGQFDYPIGIGIDKAGDLYVADYNNCRIEKLDKDGNYIAQWGTRGTDVINQFRAPMDVEFDSTGNAFVTDAGNSRIMWLPVNGGEIPNIYNVSLSTSPELGFSPGGINNLPILVGVKTSKSTALKAYIYNASGKWVAQVSVKAGKSGQYKLSWDGKATKGNTAKITAGKIVPVSAGGTKYMLKIFAQTSAGSQWSPVQTIKLYSNPAISGVLVSTLKLDPGKSTKITYQISRFSNTQVRILDAKGRIVARFVNNLCFPSKKQVVVWDGKATEGNTASLKAGAAVPKGNYTVQILAGNTIYKFKSPLTVR